MSRNVTAVKIQPLQARIRVLKAWIKDAAKPEEQWLAELWETKRKIENARALRKK